VIIAFSTSSPWASAALIDESGQVLWSEIEPANQNASGVCLRLLQAGLEAIGTDLSKANIFAADAGPGSFTGVRVGVMLAKTLAWTQGAQCAEADAFDLIAPDRTVVLPSKKGEFFVRVPGSAPVRQSEIPAECVGYGFGGEDTPPSGAGFGRLLARLTLVSPQELVPRYLIEASISQPKKPLSRRPS
jgi:hypothetical protein